MSQKAKHLFLFTIGPVQSFIAQARKTHDLYAGSQLLSNLVKAAISVVGENNIIFPSATGEAMPNRFIAWVDMPENELVEFGQRVENAVRAKWFLIANNPDEILRGVAKPDGYDEQINAHLEIFWVFEPNVTDYAKAYAAIEKSLGAIKNVRPFRQFDYEHDINGDKVYGEIGRKCGLDGQRNVKFFRKTQNHMTQNPESDVVVKQKVLFMRNGYARVLQYSKRSFKELPIRYLQPGEGLSAVSFVKRRYLAKETEEFASTADIALRSALNYLHRHHFDLLQSYENSFDEFNAQLFFEENVTDKYFGKQGIEVDPNKNLDSVLKKRAELEAIAKEGKERFSKYYAILTFDGDSMGTWLSGKYLTEGENLESFHKKFAEKLSNFAKKAKRLVDTEGGRTAYAGGDDFVGFVNLNQLFYILKKLRQLFRTEVSNELKDYRKDQKEISFSAGICIAHYKEPLTLVLDEAKKMQDKAKEVEDGEDKNRFGITVIKGSGEDHRTVWSFGENEIFTDIFNELILAIRDDKFSNGFTKTLRQEFGRLIDLDFRIRDDADIYSIFKDELKRLLMRAKSKDSSKKDSENLSNALVKMLENDLTTTTENFLEMLHIADFIQRNINYKNV
jgi:CRISPR-associated protein Cmr2